MTKEKQNVAIAKVRGWTHLVEVDGADDWHGEPPSAHSDDGLVVTCPIPRFADDLNAMHDAEKALPGNQWEEYICHLFKPGSERLAGSPVGLKPFWESDFARIHATAAQRAEAFLKTIGKWEAS